MSETKKEEYVCEGCGKPASFRCPKCASLGLAPSYFCGQDCFKRSWALHKVKHQGAAKLAEMLAAAQAAPSSWCGDERFAGYAYTGTLRKHAVSAARAVPPEIACPDYAHDRNGFPASEARATRTERIEVKTAADVAGLRAACRVAREVLDVATAAVRVGVTTDELDALVHAETLRRGAYPSPLNYELFPKSVCTSVNEVVCHGIPDARPLADGDIVNLDVTCYYRGYHGDVNETVPVGTIDDRSRRLIETAYRAMMRGIDAVRPGAHYHDIGDAIGAFVRPTGFSVVRDYCGHGIGRDFHVNPTIPHYEHNKCFGTMHVNHVFTVEPMINAGTHRDTVWPDDWTVVTADGQRSAQFENTVLVTEKGYEILTARTENSYKYWFL